MDGSLGGVRYRAPYGANNASKTDVAPYGAIIGWVGMDGWISGWGKV